MRTFDSPVTVTDMAGGTGNTTGPTIPGKPGWFSQRTAAGSYTLSFPGARRVNVSGGAIALSNGVFRVGPPGAGSVNLATLNTSWATADATYLFTAQVWY